MRRTSLLLPAAALLAWGCTPPVPVLGPGHVVRPEVHFAPPAPWPAEARVTIGALATVEAPGLAARYLRDDELLPGQLAARGRVTFFDADRPIGEPRDVTLVHDC